MLQRRLYPNFWPPAIAAPVNNVSPCTGTVIFSEGTTSHMGNEITQLSRGSKAHIAVYEHVDGNE